MGSSPDAGFSPHEALATERRLAVRIERDRLRTSSQAVPLGLFGAISLIAAVIASTGAWTALGAFWSVAGPSGGAFLGWWYRRQDLRLRFERPPTLVMVWTAVMLVGGALALGWSGEGETVFFAVGCAYVLFAAATRNRTTFVVACTIIAVTWIAQIDRWIEGSGADAPSRTALLTAAVGISQLAGAWSEVRRTRHPHA